MSIIVPVTLSEVSGASVALPVAFALTAAGSVQQGARANFAVALGCEIQGPTNFPVALNVTASGRINQEPNVFGAAQLALAVGLAATAQVSGGGAGALFAVALTLQAAGTVERGAEFGFTVFVEIIDSAIQSATRYTARLKADGVDVPITSFNFRKPGEALGASLSITLAKPLVSQVSSVASLVFELGLWTGVAWQWIVLLTGGKLAGRDAVVGFAQGRPTDTVQITALDFLGDRWSLAPAARPVTLYDPARVSSDELAGPTSGAGTVRDDSGAAIISRVGFAPADTLQTEAGSPVFPINTAVSNLNLHEALKRAYVDGCGFTRVVTNLLNVPVKRVDFTLEGGYDAGVRALLALYEPLFAPQDDGSLWIVDPDEPATLAHSSQGLPLSAVVTVKESLPPRQIAGALIVSYRADDTGEIVLGDRFENETTTGGTYGEDGFTETQARRRVRQYGRVSEPGVVSREVVVETTTTVRNHIAEIIHRETQADTYDGLNRKSGHTRTVESLVPDLSADGALALLTTVRETAALAYRAHPTRPHEYVQDTTVTQVRGLIHEDNDNQYRDQPFRLPLVDAHRNGLVDAGADQTSSFGPIKTTTESLRVRGDGQLDVSVTVVDHIANTTERSSSTPRTGSISLNANRQQQHRVLITLPGVTQGRRVPAIDAGELPRDVALRLARRKLKRLNTPARQASIKLPAVALTIRRGSIVEAYARAGASGKFIVEGYEITGERLGTKEQYVSMSLEAREAGGV